MANEVIKKYLVDGYNKVAATHNYIFGWVECGMVYGYRVMDAENLLAWITTTDRASKKNGGTVQLKFKPNRAQKLMINTEAVEVREVCTEDYLEDIRAHATGKEKNRGYIFERLACEVFGLEQNTQPNAKVTDCGDGRDADGVEYQIKYNTATFIDEKTLKNFLAQ
jgi:hypothetical protein